MLISWFFFWKMKITEVKGDFIKQTAVSLFLRLSRIFVYVMTWARDPAHGIEISSVLSMRGALFRKTPFHQLINYATKQPMSPHHPTQIDQSLDYLLDRPSVEAVVVDSRSLLAFSSRKVDRALFQNPAALWDHVIDLHVTRLLPFTLSIPPRPTSSASC